MIAQFIDHLCLFGFSPNTIAAYTRDLRPLPADRPPTTDDLRVYRARLAASGAAPSTVARKIASARSYCGWLAELAPPGWASLLTPPVHQPSPAVTLSPDEVVRLLLEPTRRRAVGTAAREQVGGARPEDYRDAALLALLYDTGCSITEALALNVEHLMVGGEVGEVTIADGCQKRRTIPLLLAGAPLVVHLEHATRQTGALFRNHRGGRLTRQGAWLLIAAHAEAAGLTAVTPHLLRATAIAHWLADRRGDEWVRDRLGGINHVALERYRPRALRRAA